MKKNISSALSSKALFLTIIILSALLSSTAVFAASEFNVNVNPVVNRITPDDVAAYNITITNKGDTDRIYSLKLSSGDATNWILSPNSMKVSAGETSSEILNVFPKSTTGVGSYELMLQVAYLSDTEEVPLNLYMNFEGLYLDYTPNVALSVSTVEVQDPRESMKVSVLMRNRNMLDMKNLTLRIKSDMFYKEVNLSLGPRKEFSSEYLFDLEALQSPGIYKIRLELYYPVNDKVVAEAETEFKVDAYSTVTPKYDSSKSWFIRRDIITVENIGNYERTKDISMKMPWFKRMFVSSDADADFVRMEGKSYLQWNPSLKPMEIKTITVTTNYRPLIVIILLLIVALVAYFMLRSPLILLKEAGVVEQDEHGISEIKVKIFIKNRSRKALEQITVTDKVPGITEYVESNNLGSMKPSRMTRTTAKGTILHWDLDKLDAFEERIITYKLKSKLKFVGDMALPRTRVKFVYGNGKERFVISPQPLFFNRLE